MTQNYVFVDVILPLPLADKFTYRISEEDAQRVQTGMRVTVPFGNKKLFTGLIYRIHQNAPATTAVKFVLNLLDETPVVSPLQLKFWEWIAEYYMCTLGEVMQAALPAEVYSEKKVSYVALSETFSETETWNSLLKQYETSPKTLKLLDLLLQFQILSKNNLKSQVLKSELLIKGRFSSAQLNNLIRKDIFKLIETSSSRLEIFESQAHAKDINLTEAQEEALNAIRFQHKNLQTVLLHGVTGSGKTEIYIKYIQEFIEQGQQVLFLLPEIALTTQIVNRLRYYFGDKVGVYHSKISDLERVEVWNRVLDFNMENSSSHQIILGARSALLLPFSKLGLIIVDEEHDASYKQTDPAPRYHAKDAALMLAQHYQAKVLLGSATPSLESYYNVQQKKFGLTELKIRYANVLLPEILTVDLKEAHQKKEMTSLFSSFLLAHIQQALERGEQIILFQNRRGFSVRLECEVCGWSPQCEHCDVSLTYHKKSNLLKCHHCGYQVKPVNRCGECGSSNLKLKGFGTEKINDELEIIFPQAKIARMDLDTTRGKNSHQRIIEDFSQQKIDILVGTQMVTKGLDFNHVSLVGILNADSLIAFPDFRAFERSFQVMAQVSGRAGRKHTRGKVIIQTYHPYHSCIRYVMENNYSELFLSQMQERQLFHYPPYIRLIKIMVKHQREEVVNKAGDQFAALLRKELPHTVLGPEFPLISRIKSQFIKEIWIKTDHAMGLKETKQKLASMIEYFKKSAGFSSVKIIVNVDSY